MNDTGANTAYYGQYPNNCGYGYRNLPPYAPTTDNRQPYQPVLTDKITITEDQPLTAEDKAKKKKNLQKEIFFSIAMLPALLGLGLAVQGIFAWMLSRKFDIKKGISNGLPLSIAVSTLFFSQAVIDAKSEKYNSYLTNIPVWAFFIVPDIAEAIVKKQKFKHPKSLIAEATLNTLFLGTLSSLKNEFFGKKDKKKEKADGNRNKEMNTQTPVPGQNYEYYGAPAQGFQGFYPVQPMQPVQPLHNREQNFNVAG